MFLKKEKDEEVKLNDAWEWYKYFETLRVFHFYIFFALSGALFAIGFHVIMSSRLVNWLVPIISYIGIVISLAFIFLDLRNAELELRGLAELKKFEFDPAEHSEETYQEAVHPLRDETPRMKEKWEKEARTLKPFISHTMWYRTIYLMGFSASIITLICFTASDFNWLFLLGYFIFIVGACFLKWRRR